MKGIELCAAYLLSNLAACAGSSRAPSEAAPSNVSSSAPPPVAVANTFGYFPENDSDEEHDCELFLTPEEARAAASAMSSNWQHESSRPFLMRGALPSAPPTRLDVRDNADAFYALEKPTTQPELVIQLAPRYTNLDARIKGTTESYCVGSRTMNNGVLHITWLTTKGRIVH
jgi:hypothetical protein